MTRMDATSPVPRTIGDDDRNGEHTHAFGQGAQHRECPGGQLADALAEAAPHQLIGGEHFAAEILRQKQNGNDDAGQQVAEHQLQKLEIARRRPAPAFR